LNPSGVELNLKLKAICYKIIVSLFPKKVEIQAIMKYYDTDNSGSISYEEFISGLK